MNFEPHLHNQDGVILTWCYFKMYLPGQVLYEHKIWAHLDKQFLIYKTKGNYVCVCVGGGGGVTSLVSVYFARTYWHEQKESMTLGHLHLQNSDFKVSALNLMCIIKMALYWLDVILIYVSQVKFYRHTKFGNIWTCNSWDTKHREIARKFWTSFA